MLKSNIVLEYGFIIVGCFMLAASTNLLFAPHQIVIGGVTGISVILQVMFNIPLWLTFLTLNIPLYVVAFGVFGRKKLYRMLFTTGLLTFALFLTSGLPPLDVNDFILISLYGGVMGGVGVGLVFRGFSATGGSDLAATLIHKMKLPHVSVGKIMFVLDAMVITLGFFVSGLETGMYAIIIVFIAAKVIDSIQEGLSFAKAAFIISEKEEDIADTIMREMNRGVTSLTGVGMYTKSNKNVLLCIVSTKQIVEIKRLAHQIDQNAFVIVADVREVMGEGFTNTK